MTMVCKKKVFSQVTGFLVNKLNDQNTSEENKQPIV